MERFAGPARSYTGPALAMISFPLGGIGTGTIGLGGRGELRDWEIFNAPNLGYRPPYTMPFLFVRSGRRKRAVVLERRLLPPFHASGGLPPAELPGLPRLAEAVFVGTYPVARLRFADASLPVRVALTAFNPMLPLNPDDSAIPAAVLTYTVANRTRGPVEGTLAISLANVVGMSSPDGIGGNVNACRRADGLNGLFYTSDKYAADHPGFGSMALATPADDVTVTADFGQEGWFDLGQKLWDDFSDDGLLSGPSSSSTVAAPGGADRRRPPVGMLGARFRLGAGERTDIVFVIAWCFPNALANWMLPKDAKPVAVRNHYAGRFPDAWSAAAYLNANLDRLKDRTLAFERALFGSTLPEAVLDAVSSQMAILRTPTAMWLDVPPGERAGRIFGFEGCNPKSGCCPMNCTHVWNYEQSLAHLYPSLERSMRVTDYLDNVRDGAMAFRTVIPLGGQPPDRLARNPAADGQFGTVVKTYREWRISGDTEWLRRLWPAVKSSLDFAWRGFAGWDADKDGVLEGPHHNTYDIEFHGPETMCGSLYLAALKAGAEMARALGDDAAAAEYQAVLNSGAEEQDRLLFNGQYYYQRVSQVRREYASLAGVRIPPGRPRYQFGHGCLSDQLLGQWAAHVAGLGYVLPEGHVRRALSAVFRHNFKPRLHDHECCQRGYAFNDEAGLLLCTWPKGRREQFPFPYSDEVWTGIEYQVAAHLMYEGLIQPGLAIVRAARARHDGVRRNPWNEYECGDHYARAMSSWSLLLALSGQGYDGRSRTLSVRPVWRAARFACLFTAAEGYGVYRQQSLGAGLAFQVECVDGRVALSALEVVPPPLARRRAMQAVACSLVSSSCGTAAIARGGNGQPVPARARPAGRATLVVLDNSVTLRPGDRLTCRLAPRK